MAGDDRIIIPESLASANYVSIDILVKSLEGGSAISHTIS